jgi:hypothetical protein
MNHNLRIGNRLGKRSGIAARCYDNLHTLILKSLDEALERRGDSGRRLGCDSGIERGVQLTRNSGGLSLAIDLSEKLGKRTLIVSAGKVKSLKPCVKCDSVSLENAGCRFEKDFRTVKNGEIEFDYNTF